MCVSTPLREKQLNNESLDAPLFTTPADALTRRETPRDAARRRDAPRRAVTRRDAPRRAATRRDVPRRAATCRDVPRRALSVWSSRMVKQGCSPFPCPPLVDSSPPRGGTRWMGKSGGPWDNSGASGGPR